MHDEAVRKDLQKCLDGEDDQKHIFNLFLERHKDKKEHKKNQLKMVLSQLFLSFAVVSVGNISLYFQTFTLVVVVSSSCHSFQ